MSPSDIQESTPKGVGALVKALAQNKGQASNEAQLFDEVEEYFRQRFRKIDAIEAEDIVRDLSELNN